MHKEFPCGVCCKHIHVDKNMWERGGIATCEHCKTKVKVRPHPPKGEAKKD